MALSSSIYSPLSTLAKPLSRFRYSRFPQSYSFPLLHFLHDYSNTHSHTVTYLGTHTHRRLRHSLTLSLLYPSRGGRRLSQRRALFVISVFPPWQAAKRPYKGKSVLCVGTLPSLN